MTQTTYTPEAIDLIRRDFANILASLPYGGTITGIHGKDGEPPTFGQLLDTFHAYREHMVDVARWNTEIENEKRQLSADIAAVRRIFGTTAEAAR